MRTDWLLEIRAAQNVKRTKRGIAYFNRIPYGQGARQVFGGTCPDCAAPFGQLHVPGCDGEECPSCGGQAISCDC